MRGTIVFWIFSIAGIALAGCKAEPPRTVPPGSEPNTLIRIPEDEGLGHHLVLKTEFSKMIQDARDAKFPRSVSLLQSVDQTSGDEWTTLAFDRSSSASSGSNVRSSIYTKKMKGGHEVVLPLSCEQDWAVRTYYVQLRALASVQAAERLLDEGHREAAREILTGMLLRGSASIRVLGEAWDLLCHCAPLDEVDSIMAEVVPTHAAFKSQVSVQLDLAASSYIERMDFANCRVVALYRGCLIALSLDDRVSVAHPSDSSRPQRPKHFYVYVPNSMEEMRSIGMRTIVARGAMEAQVGPITAQDFTVVVPTAQDRRR